MDLSLITYFRDKLPRCVAYVPLFLLSCSAVAQVPEVAWQYRQEMTQSAWRAFGPGAPVATLAAQIHQESGWDCSAVSWAGAKGCAQFTNPAEKDAAYFWPKDCDPANPFDPGWAFRCRDLYLRQQIKAGPPGDTECDDWAFGFRSYNGGLGWTRRDRKLAKTAGDNPDDWQAVQPYNSGRRLSAWKENTEYPVRIFRLERRYTEWGRALKCS